MKLNLMQVITSWWKRHTSRRYQGTISKGVTYSTKGGSLVELLAEDGSTVYAYENAIVWAAKGSTVYAYKGAVVWAADGATVHANPGSVVHASPNSLIFS